MSGSAPAKKAAPKPTKQAERLSRLEKENAQLREDVDTVAWLFAEFMQKLRERMAEQYVEQLRKADPAALKREVMARLP